MTKEIETHLRANSNMTKKQIMISNFLGGLSWGFGSIVGATLMVAILIKLLGAINFVPVLGNFAADIVSTVNQKVQK